MAVKIMRTDDEEKMNSAKNEFNIMKKLKHQNIVEVKEIFVDLFKHQIYTLMEFIDGKELFDTIVESGAFTGKLFINSNPLRTLLENIARRMFK